MAAKISSFSDFSDNYRYLSYKYGIRKHVWHLLLCKFYKCFDWFLLNHHKTIANGVVAIAISTIAITHLYIISIQIAIMSIVKPCLHITMK